LEELCSNCIRSLPIVGLLNTVATGAIGFVASAIPAVLVGQQAYTEWRRRFLLESALRTATTTGRLESALTRLKASMPPDGPRQRYVLLMTSLFLVSAILFCTLFMEVGSHLSWPYPNCQVRCQILRGMRYGGVGAYVYVVFSLGRRAVQRDVSLGAGWWGLVTLVTGPILAALLALVFRDASDKSWEVAALYFVAGLAPRRITDSVASVVRRTYLPGSDGGTQSTRLVPVTQLRGIGAETAERLDEERVTSTTLMAMADPLKLTNNTNFTLRQVTNWMDEALLMEFAPKTWQSFEDQGISGAIDLAWLADKPQEMADLATAMKLEKTTLASLIERLAEDGQVQAVWTLYQLGSDDVKESEPDSDAMFHPITPPKESTR
jgi:hypothetical protein